MPRAAKRSEAENIAIIEEMANLPIETKIRANFRTFLKTPTQATADEVQANIEVYLSTFAEREIAKVYAKFGLPVPVVPDVKQEELPGL
jgi:hypothetical protein